MPINEPIGHIDAPLPRHLAHELTLVWGWAVDRTSDKGPGIQAVHVYLDGLHKGDANLGMQRHDVADVFGPGFLNSGWQFALDLRAAPPGEHSLEIIVRSRLSNTETTCSQSILVDGRGEPVRGKKLALLVSGCPGDPMRYRCHHAAEQLRFQGGTADVVSYDEVDFGAALEQYHVVILHRVLLNADVQWFLQQTRTRKLPVLYDLDDLIFDPDLALSQIAEIEKMTPRERAQFFDCVVRTREALIATGSALVATSPLRAMVNQIFEKDRAHVIPNVVGEDMLRQAETAKRELVDSASDLLTMAYFSGTPTHDRDFLTAADAVLWILERYANTRLVTVGPVTVDERFRVFGQRVQQLPRRSWQELAHALALVDINLAPLEPCNVFTDSKSCIKYLEASLVGVPTVASPRSDFARVIEQGVNGYLAESPAEWRAAISKLLESSELRRRIGQTARADVLARHTTRAAAPRLWQTLGEFVDQRDFEPSISRSSVLS